MYCYYIQSKYPFHRDALGASCEVPFQT